MLNLPKLTIRTLPWTKNAFRLQIRKSVYKCEQVRSFLKKLLMINLIFCAYYPANIYLFKFSNRNVEMVWNMLQVSNKDTRTTSMTLFWCLYCELWTYFTSFSSVSIFDFETCNCWLAYWFWSHLEHYAALYSNAFIYSFEHKSTSWAKLVFQ